ncbi:MAG TPA: hypothetical protein VFC21_06090 [Bryobacteraceae bacterium]|nr:hypothetical protein [Bryobacteraceae bacterium]
MRRAFVAAATFAAVGLAGCGVHVGNAQAGTGQTVQLDAKTHLQVSTEGGPVRQSLQETVGLSGAYAGQFLRRVLQSPDGKVLFAYDLQVDKGAGAGTYRLLLKPAAKGPTFQKFREVSVNAMDNAVRVELMERPDTGQKIVDVFQLASGSESPQMSFGAHLMQVHNRFFRWVHGQ